MKTTSTLYNVNKTVQRINCIEYSTVSLYNACEHIHTQGREGLCDTTINEKEVN